MSYYPPFGQRGEVKGGALAAARARGLKDFLYITPLVAIGDILPFLKGESL